MFRKLSLIVPFLLAVVMAQAQCAMCRTQVVNNVSAGETNMAAGLNFGIIYLFTTPYLLVALVAFLWYRYSKVNVKKHRLRSSANR